MLIPKSRISLLAVLCFLLGYLLPGQAQECDMVAHIVTKDGASEENSLVLFEDGFSTKYTTLQELEGNKGFFYDDTYYITIEATGDGERVYRYYDVSTWSHSSTYSRSDNGRKVVSMIYDPVSGGVYSVEQNLVTSEWLWQKYYMQDGVLMPVEGEFKVLPRAYYALCVAANGMIYGFGNDAGLYKLEPMDGTSQKLFTTGSVGMEQQSSWMDESGGNIYRAVSSSIGTTVYCYNLNNSTEKFIKIYTSLSAIVSMAADDFPAEDSKPESVAHIEVRWGESPNDAIISFTTPDEDINGNTLTDTLVVTVMVDSEVIDTLHVLPQTACEVLCKLSDGMHNISVVVANEQGESIPTVSQVFVGYDNPQPVGRVDVNCDFPCVDVWWSHPMGEHGHAVDVENLRYRVVRYPDCVLVADTNATAIRDTLPLMPLQYSYGVTAYLPHYETEESISAPFYYDCTMEPPLSISNWETGIFNAFIVDDANADGKTWGCFETASGNVALRYVYSSLHTADDYLYFPTMYLQAGNYYEAVLHVHAGSEKYSEVFSVGLMPEEQADGSVELLSNEVVATKSSTPYAMDFVVSESGKYRLYVHCSSPANHYMLYIDSLSIAVSQETAQPQEVSHVELLKDENPSIIHVRCIAPTTTVGGALLDTLDEVVIYRNEAPICVVTSPQPGEAISYRDSVDTIDNYTYKIVASNSHGSSRPVVESVVCGVAQLPISNDFINGIGYYTVTDNNKDGVTWHFYEDRYMGCMRYMSSEVNDADDWLISPPVYFPKSARYQVEYRCSAGHSHYPESLRVKLGNSKEPNAMSVVIDELEKFTFINDSLIIVPFDIYLPGNYYIAFHAASRSDSYSIMLRSVTLSDYDPMSVSIAQAENCRVWGGEGCIMIESTTDCEAVIYSLDGRVLEKVKVTQWVHRCDVTQGVYIVAVNDRRVKVVVR